MTDQDTSKELHDFLTDDPDEAIGLATGINADGTVNVQGENGSVNAIAATPCTTQATLLQRVNGTWYAFQSQNQTVSDNTLISRRSRPRNSAINAPIKILFAILNDNIWDLYIGGDRPKPTKIYSTPSLPTESHLSNTGTGLKDWVVGLKLNNSIINIFGGEKDPFICNETWARFLTWQGAGIWTYNMQPDVVETTIYESATYDNNTEVTTQLTGDTLKVLSTTNPLLIVTGKYEDHYTLARGGTTTIIEDIENKTFVFYKSLSSHSGKTERFAETIAPKTGTITAKDYRSKTTPIYLSPNREVKYSQRVEDYQHNYVESIDSNGSRVITTILYRNIVNIADILPAIMSGKNTHTYRKKQLNITQSAIGQPFVTTTLLDALLIESSSTKSKPPEQLSSIPYQTALDSLTPNLGATLKGKNYYLVAPSTKINPGESIYTTGIWSQKTKSNYARLPNVYDNPDPTKKLLKVPVWKVAFKENSFEIAKDEEATVLPLLANPRIIAASYYP